MTTSSTLSVPSHQVWGDGVAPGHYHQPWNPNPYPITDGKMTINGVSANDAFTPELAFEVMVLTLDMGWPIGVGCMECESTFEEGDIVLAGQKRMVGWIGWHTRCLKGILDESPLDDFETTKQKLLNGEDPFE